MQNQLDVDVKIKSDEQILVITEEACALYLD